MVEIYTETVITTLSLKANSTSQHSMAAHSVSGLTSISIDASQNPPSQGKRKQPGDITSLGIRVHSSCWACSSCWTFTGCCGRGLSCHPKDVRCWISLEKKLAMAVGQCYGGPWKRPWRFWRWPVGKWTPVAAVAGKRGPLIVRLHVCTSRLSHFPEW